MSKKPGKSEKGLLEQSRVALLNAQTQTEISSRIAAYGYDAAKLQEGQALWDNTNAVWNTNQQINQETTEASNNFKKQKETLFSLYNEHRKKAKAKFKREPQILEQLQITGTEPNVYLDRMQTIKHFYDQIAQSQYITTELQSYNIQASEFETANTLITYTESARAEYVKKDGESQDATKQKDKAMKELEYWMQDFYAMADIALKDKPQLLESLGLFRKS